MKYEPYVNWLNTNNIYKQKLISELSSLQTQNLINTIINTTIDNSQIEYILSHKFYDLLNDMKYVNLISKYKNADLLKVQTLSQCTPLHIVYNLLSKVQIQRLNKQNIHSILEYVINENNFSNKSVNVGWGPGNHGDIATNIDEHYKKHVLTNEGIHWSKLLTTMTHDSYMNYAIDSFYKMKNVIIHSNGKNVHLSGFYGNVFIVGRYHEGIFGISSCYYVENGEKNGRLQNLCFGINFINF